MAPFSLLFAETLPKDLDSSKEDLCWPVVPYKLNCYPRPAEVSLKYPLPHFGFFLLHFYQRDVGFLGGIIILWSPLSGTESRINPRSRSKEADAWFFCPPRTKLSARIVRYMFWPGSAAFSLKQACEGKSEVGRTTSWLSSG